MKSFIISVLSFVLVVGWLSVNAQIEHGGVPASFNFKQLSSDVDQIMIHPPDMNQIMIEDGQNEKNGQMYMVSRLLPVGANMNNCGTWTDLPDGTRIWRLKITSVGAKALSVHYSKLVLPEGAEFFLYNNNRNQVAGSFNHKNNDAFEQGGSTRIIEGETTWLEYVAAPNITEDAIIEIERISYFYRGVNSLIGYYADTKDTGYGDSGNCEVDVNCPEGNNWQTQKKGVAEIYIIDGWSGGFCTGTLINNTSNDGTPYFLTAEHCGGDVSASDMNQWEFYFHFEGATCNYSGAEPSYNTITGCVKRADGPISGGSDFLLLELNCTETDLANINAYNNGWSRSTTGSPSGVGIHHPQGDIKKISTYTSALVVSSYTGSLSNAHWRVTWVETGTNHGVTEQGSSGSPIFNNNKLVVGTLTGGGASCSALTQPDFYGRFDIHWDNTANGSGDAAKLEPWLDPDGTGDETCPGRSPGATSSLTADFNGTPTTVAVGGNVSFTDMSTGGTITSWDWEFEGGTPGTASGANQTVNYPAAGVYNVTLTVSDGTDTDQEIKTDYITVTDGGGGTLNAQFVASEYTIFEGQCINFQDQSTGDPTSWSWSFPGSSTPTSTDQNPTNICYPDAGSYNVTLTVENATDTDTETVNACITVEVNPTIPIAQFEANATVIPVGGVVIFTNLSENGPFDSWAWTFEGGIPATSNDSAPIPITYNEVGMFDVELRCENTGGVQDIEFKNNYIKVIPEATGPPTANFIANYTVIQPGDAINLIDISEGYPYLWEWSIEGGSTTSETTQNVSNVVFAAEGTYDVQLIVRNNEGADTLLKEDYIVVSLADPCNEAPQTNFRAAPRLIEAGQTVFFEDLSTNLPQYWNWNFGNTATPQYSNEASPTDGIVYNIPGIYDVTLSVNNGCGSSTHTKDDYIYVFSGPVSMYCDTLSNIGPNEVTIDYVNPIVGGWGWVGGHNSERIRYYADYFEDYTFDQIQSIIVPVSRSIWGEYQAYTYFKIWDASGDTIGEELASKKVYLRNLHPNFSNVITFDQPVPVEGPFYIGFKLDNSDTDNDGISDDIFVVEIANPRGASESQNTLYMEKSNVWYSCVEYFGFATSLSIKPVACLLDIDQIVLDANISVYPNPARDRINIEIGPDFAGSYALIKLYDITGKLVDIPVSNEANDVYSINLVNVPEGMYLVNIYVDGKMISRKITIEK
jgi:PKD repeat protein